MSLQNLFNRMSSMLSPSSTDHDNVKDPTATTNTTTKSDKNPIAGSVSDSLEVQASNKVKQLRSKILEFEQKRDHLDFQYQDYTRKAKEKLTLSAKLMENNYATKNNSLTVSESNEISDNHTNNSANSISGSASKPGPISNVNSNITSSILPQDKNAAKLLLIKANSCQKQSQALDNQILMLENQAVEIETAVINASTASVLKEGVEMHKKLLQGSSNLNIKNNSGTGIDANSLENLMDNMSDLQLQQSEINDIYAQHAEECIANSSADMIHQNSNLNMSQNSNGNQSSSTIVTIDDQLNAMVHAVELEKLVNCEAEMKDLRSGCSILPGNGSPRIHLNTVSTGVPSSASSEAEAEIQNLSETALSKAVVDESPDVSLKKLQKELGFC